MRCASKHVARSGTLLPGGSPVRVHLVDGTFELYRAHFAPRPPLGTPALEALKATVGVVRSMAALLADPGEAVTHLAVAFDNPIASFRNRLFAAYKSDDGVEPELRRQFDGVELGVAALGVRVWRMVDFEADDALATAAVRLAATPGVDQVRILTPDKDLGQVLRGDAVVQVDRIRRRVLTEATLLETKGLTPAQVPDFLALVGDTADGIPGLDGWGEKSAAAVLRAHGRLEAIPDAVEAWAVQPRSAARLAQELATHRAEARLYQALATLRTDVPLDVSLEALRWRGPAPGFVGWFRALGLEPPRLPAPRP
jgi:5'-3' exonuclease